MFLNIVLANFLKIVIVNQTSLIHCIFSFFVVTRVILLFLNCNHNFNAKNYSKRRLTINFLIFWLTLLNISLIGRSKCVTQACDTTPIYY